nr:nucleosome assembly protein 1,4 [Tanacetum cinerariifolium]
MRDTLVDIRFESEVLTCKEVEIRLGVRRDKPLPLTDMLLYSWDRCLDVCVDLTCSSPLTQSGIVDFVLRRVVVEAAQRKRVKYDAKCANTRYREKVASDVISTVKVRLKGVSRIFELRALYSFCVASVLREVFNHSKKLDHFGYEIINKIGIIVVLNSPRTFVIYDICGDGGLQIIGQFCKKLGKLNHDGWVTQIRLIALAQGCPHLDCIEVYLLDISNEALECVGTHLKNLNEPRIVLGKEEGITSLDNKVRDLQMGCRKLEKLDMNLFPCGLTDVGLGYIGEYGHNPRNLSLSYTGGSDVGLLELSQGDKGDAGYHGVLISPMVSDEASLYLFTMEPPLGLVT